MKNNNKNRNLKFIRVKNLLRTGKASFLYYHKVSKEYTLYVEKENRLIIALNMAKEQLFKKHKLIFNNPKVLFDSAYCDDDFIKNFYTERIELRLK